MKRKVALATARVAGYHADTKSFTRLMIESRVNRAQLDKEYQLGATLKKGGTPCDCHECNRKRP